MEWEVGLRLASAWLRLASHRFHADSLALCTVEVLGALRELLKVDILAHIHLPKHESEGCALLPPHLGLGTLSSCPNDLRSTYHSVSEHVKVCLCIQVLAHESMYTTVQYVSNL